MFYHFKIIFQIKNTFFLNYFKIELLVLQNVFKKNTIILLLKKILLDILVNTWLTFFLFGLKLRRHSYNS